jgi:hypothetical protein
MSLIYTLLSSFSLHPAKVYSAAQKAAKAEGKSAADAWEDAQAARKEYLVLL